MFSELNFKNKRAVVRVDFNVPLDKNTLSVTDATRIKAALPTLKKILTDGGSIVLLSHLGRPQNGYENKYSLRHLIPTIEKSLHSTGIPFRLFFAKDCIGADIEAQARNLQAGDLLLAENVRFHPEEEKGKTDFAKALAQLGDIYVNDAFGTAHRAHASTSVIAGFFPKEKKTFGYLMESEIINARKISMHPSPPLTAIIGGAKVSDKLLIIENLLEKAQYILIGGGMAYTFLKAQGKNIGKSIVDDSKIGLVKQLLIKAETKKVPILLPKDHIITDYLDHPTQIQETDTISNNFLGVDIGPQTRVQFHQILQKSKTILWNGPMGVFETEAFSNGTQSVAHSVAEATAQNNAYSLIGGGDSVAAIHKYGLAEKVCYISTGGGALLEFFEGKVLPGIDAIER